jgi:hypothetical protein
MIHMPLKWHHIDTCNKNYKKVDFLTLGCVHNTRSQGLRVQHIKSCTPMTLKNDYMSCKDYNLMRSLSKCLYTYEFSSK